MVITAIVSRGAYEVTASSSCKCHCPASCALFPETRPECGFPEMVAWLIQSGYRAGGQDLVPSLPPCSVAVAFSQAAVPFLPLPLPSISSISLSFQNKTKWIQGFPLPFLLYLFRSLENTSRVSILLVLADGVLRYDWVWCRGKCKKLFRDECGLEDKTLPQWGSSIARSNTGCMTSI